MCACVSCPTSPSRSQQRRTSTHDRPEISIKLKGRPFLVEWKYWNGIWENRKMTQVEREHVHSVYSQIAPHFSDTRFKPWPRIAQFLKEQPLGSLIADVGE